MFISPSLGYEHGQLLNWHLLKNSKFQDRDDGHFGQLYSYPQVIQNYHCYYNLRKGKEVLDQLTILF
jgi:hypothetical protein